MSHWNTLEHPPDGLEPPGLPLITKMRQKGYNIKTLKYLQWINKYVLSVTEKTEIGSDWRIHPNYEIFSHYISDLTQNLMPYFLPYSYSTGTLMHFLSFPVADWSVTTLQKSFKLITVNFCPRCRIEEKCCGSWPNMSNFWANHSLLETTILNTLLELHIPKRVPPPPRSCHLLYFLQILTTTYEQVCVMFYIGF